MDIKTRIGQEASSFFYLLGSMPRLWQYRELIGLMTWRNFSARYRGSVGGIVWSIGHPLVTTILYTVVFAIFLQVRFGQSSNPGTFGIYLLCGLLPWTALSEGVNLSANVIRLNINFVKRVIFPVQVLPFTLALTASIQEWIGFFLLVPMIALVTGHLSWTITLLPLIWLFQILFAVGINWMIASLAVYVPELTQAVPLLLTIWMFLTPIFYPEETLPATAQGLMAFNPLARLVSLFRRVLISGELPNVFEFASVALICTSVFGIGYVWFMRTKKGFPDVL